MGGTEKGSNALEDVLFGSIAGMTAKVFEHPFDLVKVRLQSQPTDRPLSFHGPVDCFKQTYSKEGWKGLYRGLTAPLVGAACENACLFFVYNKCQSWILEYNPLRTVTGVDGLSEKAKGKRRDLTAPELALAAAGAGAAASFILTPIELIKCRMQVQMLAREGAFGPAPVLPSSISPKSTITPIASTLSTAAAATRPFSTSLRLRNLHSPPAGLPPLQGPLALIVDTVRTNGLRGLWLGQVGTLFRETGGSSAWFSAYELVSKTFLKRRQKISDQNGSTRVLTKADLPTHELMISGACAGMSYNVILFPADSVKSAMQTWSEIHPGKERVGFWKMAKKIWSTRGIRGMYAGCGLTVLRSAPSSAMIFVIYETLEKKFGGILG